MSSKKGKLSRASSSFHGNLPIYASKDRKRMSAEFRTRIANFLVYILAISTPAMVLAFYYTFIYNPYGHYQAVLSNSTSWNDSPFVNPYSIRHQFSSPYSANVYERGSFVTIVRNIRRNSSAV
ncbi:hypothetical protein RvY_18028 [Ramazzottius varieornatus]|uniref:Uncharacterized protein n=1 Tax=Ramazzottius varieornatus TaxID=947166 RepID=A0A1D1W498_RAMVA|nr:hypothetical protein RvY_18028 [Ramazzottius varieornatus]